MLHKYKYIRNMILILLLLSCSHMFLVSWLNGEQNKIFIEYLEQSNSKLAKNIRMENYGIQPNIVTYLPLVIDNLDSNRAKLLERTFHKELLTDGVTSELPEEIGVLLNLKTSISNFFNPLKIDAESIFGKVKIKENTIIDTELNVEKNQDYLFFITSENPEILTVQYENLIVSEIKLVGKKKGTTKLNLMLITAEGTRISSKKVVVK